MTINAAWNSSRSFQWIMSIIATCLVGGLVGIIAMYAEVKVASAAVQAMQHDLRVVAERVLYLERLRQFEDRDPQP